VDLWKTASRFTHRAHRSYSYNKAIFIPYPAPLHGEPLTGEDKFKAPFAMFTNPENLKPIVRGCKSETQITLPINTKLTVY